MWLTAPIVLEKDENMLTIHHSSSGVAMIARIPALKGTHYKRNNEGELATPSPSSFLPDTFLGHFHLTARKEQNTLLTHSRTGFSIQAGILTTIEPALFLLALCLATLGGLQPRTRGGYLRTRRATRLSPAAAERWHDGSSTADTESALRLRGIPLEPGSRSGLGLALGNSATVEAGARIERGVERGVIRPPSPPSPLSLSPLSPPSPPPPKGAGAGAGAEKGAGAGKAAGGRVPGASVEKLVAEQREWEAGIVKTTDVITYSQDDLAKVGFWERLAELGRWARLTGCRLRSRGRC
jgi:hypothetical protein